MAADRLNLTGYLPIDTELLSSIFQLQKAFTTDCTDDTDKMGPLIPEIRGQKKPGNFTRRAVEGFGCKFCANLGMLIKTIR